MASSTFNTDTMKAYLRPVVEDAAESLDYGGYIRGVDEAMAWFDALPVEGVQEILMTAVQAAILFGLDYGPDFLPDFALIPTIEEREA